MKRIIFLLAFLISSLNSSWATAANVSVMATVDNNQVGVGEPVTLSIVVSAPDGSFEAEEPRLPDMVGADVVNAFTSSSSSSKLVQTNQGMSFETVRTQNYNYVLMPKQKGTFTIGSAQVVVDGKTYSTKPIIVQVGSGGAGAQRGRPQGGRGGVNVFPPGSMPPDEEQDEAEEIFNQLLQRKKQAEPAYRSAPKNLNEAFFIQVEVDKTDVYEGEQINANWYIYVRGQPEQLDRVKFPDLRGFWKEDIEPAPALTFSQEVINGVVYKKALLASHALFPIKAGAAYIDEYKVKCVMRLPTNSFGGFGFGQPYTFTKSSEKVKVNVKPLPKDGRPADFSGAVGQFDISAKVEGTSFPANQPFVLKVRFEGEGNAKLIDLPPIEWPATVELYDTKQESKFYKNGRSYKEFEVLLIPRQAGDITLPKISFSMFDPSLGKYITKSTEPIPMKIEPGKTDSNLPSNRVAGAGAAPTQSATPAPDQLPDVLLSYEAHSAPSHTTQLLIWLAFMMASCIFLTLRLRSAMGWGVRKKDLKAQIEQRFKKAYSALEKEDYRLVGTEVTNIVYYTLGEVSGLGGASLELSKLMAEAPPSVRRELSEPVMKIMEVFQLLSFAPDGAIAGLKDKKMMKKNLQEVEKLMMRAVSLGTQEPALENQ